MVPLPVATPIFSNGTKHTRKSTDTEKRVSREQRKIDSGRVPRTFLRWWHLRRGCLQQLLTTRLGATISQWTFIHYVGVVSFEPDACHAIQVA